MLWQIIVALAFLFRFPATVAPFLSILGFLDDGHAVLVGEDGVSIDLEVMWKRA